MGLREGAAWQSAAAVSPIKRRQWRTGGEGRTGQGVANAATRSFGLLAAGLEELSGQAEVSRDNAAFRVLAINVNSYIITLLAQKAQWEHLSFTTFYTSHAWSFIKYFGKFCAFSNQAVQHTQLGLLKFILQIFFF